MINTKRDRKNLYLQLDRLNMIKRLSKLLERNGGYHCRLEDGRFVPNSPAMAVEAPWIYVKSDIMSRCDIYHRVFFDILGMIPSGCRKCWKEVK